MSDKIKLSKKHTLSLQNRDGYLYVGRDKDENYYLILDADTFHNPEVFEGMGSTEHVIINKEVFLGLRQK